MFFNLEVDKYLAADAQLRFLRFSPLYSLCLTRTLLLYCWFTALLELDEYLAVAAALHPSAAVFFLFTYRFFTFFFLV